MAEDDKKLTLGRYEGASHAAPYPLSRMAPAFSLVEIAEQIEKADTLIAAVTTSKLALVAEQMRALQEQARVLLERAKRDAELHRAHCRFEKKPGGIYHLYRKDNGELWFSLLGPDEWTMKHPQTYVASYRLEADMSFTPMAEVDTQDAQAREIARLLGT